MINDVAGVGVTISIEKDFEAALQDTIAIHTSIKNSLAPFCSMALVISAASLPYTLAK